MSKGLDTSNAWVYEFPRSRGYKLAKHTRTYRGQTTVQGFNFHDCIMVDANILHPNLQKTKLLLAKDTTIHKCTNYQGHWGYKLAKHTRMNRALLSQGT